MRNQLSLLCVRGVGHSEIDSEVRRSWSQAILRAVESDSESLQPSIDFVAYDAPFDRAPPNALTYASALDKLLASSIVHGVGDSRPGTHERMLFYSGHGAQIPRYNAQEEPDHVDECLVPYDFDWSPAYAILDRQFSELYSQLSYDSYFVAMLDCCHAGGMTRDGGPRVRGLNPPDDIRHRARRWEPTEQMWVPRDFPALNRGLSARKDGAAKGTNPSFQQLNGLVTAKLHRLRYSQTPNLVGAKARCEAQMPWGLSGTGAPAKRRARRLQAAPRKRAGRTGGQPTR